MVIWWFLCWFHWVFGVLNRARKKRSKIFPYARCYFDYRWEWFNTRANVDGFSTSLVIRRSGAVGSCFCILFLELLSHQKWLFCAYGRLRSCSYWRQRFLVDGEADSSKVSSSVLCCSHKLFLFVLKFLFTVELQKWKMYYVFHRWRWCLLLQQRCA